MEHEVKKAFETVVEYFATQLNPAQMNKFGEVLTGMIQNNLDCVTMTKIGNDESTFEALVEYAVDVCEITILLQRLNKYKIASCGEKLNIVVE